MAFDQRRKLAADSKSDAECKKNCSESGGVICPKDCQKVCPVCIPPPPLPPPPTPNQDSHKLISTNLIVLASVLCGTFLLGACCIIILSYYKKWRNSRRRRRNSAVLDDTHEDFFDENHGPVVDHHIWFITTVGLQQSVIDSITVCKYKKDEGLIEGTECSVCLSEFEEDETLRLLPKCSHAFHLPCIDTWLRSHKNCPLCRAPVVCESNGGHASVVESNSNDSGSREEETQMENFQNYGGMGSHQEGEGGTSEMRIGDDEFGGLSNEDAKIAEILKGLPYFNQRNSRNRVKSDLADNRRMVEDELQPVRRSVSMDSSSASVIYRAMANVLPEEYEGTSDSSVIEVKKLNSDIVSKRGNGSSSIYKLMKSSSNGHSLQKGPISMKRSFSSGRKFLSSRSSRSQSSVLPL